MGTPDIAATCLKKILADGFDVVGVYTQPDRPKGRGMKLVASPVKEVAVAAGIPVFQPENFREEETVEQLRALQPDICAVVAYGRILPQKVLDVPKYGCINIHASLLPKYRGSAPYQWAVLDGLITHLESLRLRFVETKDKAYWDDIIQLLPSSYNQLRTCTMNYENLLNMYRARKNHKLAEWRVYCDWIATLPYAADLITFSPEGQGVAGE